MSRITITVTDRNGAERTREVDEGTKLSTIVGSNLQGVLMTGPDGVSRQVTRDVELRDGDAIEMVAVSGKNG